MGDRLRGVLALVAGMIAPLGGAVGLWVGVQIGIPGPGPVVVGLATVAIVGALTGLVVRGKRGWGLMTMGVAVGFAVVLPNLFVLAPPPAELVLGIGLIVVGLASFAYLVTAWALAPER